MSAYLELRATGALGSDGAELLYTTVASVIRRYRLPPEEGTRWTADAMREVAHDFLTDDAGPRRLASLYLRSTDDRSLAQLMEAAVRSFLLDRARRRDVGPLRRRLLDILRTTDEVLELKTASGPAFAVPPHRGQDVYAGDPAPLLAAAWKTPDVRIVRWRSQTRRDPVADRPSLIRFAKAVLTEAAAPVPLVTLVDVAVQRFALAAPPLVVALDDEPGVASQSAEGQALAQIRAAEAWAQLTSRERILLSHHGQTVREVGGAVGLGKSAAAAALSRLNEVLTQLLAGDPDAEQVWAALQERAAEDLRAPDDRRGFDA